MRSDATWRSKRACPVVHTDVVQRARRHQRLFSGLAFALLALIAELLGRSLAHRLDVGRHVSSPSYSGADYYPFLLAAVKLGVALLLARLWLAAFTVTSVFALGHVDADRAATGRWPLLWPWLHTSALPVFAVLAVLVALAWSAVSRWLNEYERYARDTCARAERLSCAAVLPREQPRDKVSLPPRKLFGLAFESRPPPLLA